jgi:hypothetical protein
MRERKGSGRNDMTPFSADGFLTVLTSVASLIAAATSHDVVARTVPTDGAPQSLSPASAG